MVGAAQLIADNACADYFVLGPPAPDGWQSIDLAAHRVTGRVNDGAPREGVGANVLGDPREALAWLVNELSTPERDAGGRPDRDHRHLSGPTGC